MSVRQRVVMYATVVASLIMLVQILLLTHLNMNLSDRVHTLEMKELLR